MGALTRLAPCLMRSASPTSKCRKTRKVNRIGGGAASVGVNRSSFLVGDLLLGKLGEMIVIHGYRQCLSYNQIDDVRIRRVIEHLLVR